MGAKRVSKQGVTVSEGNAIEVTNTAGTALFSVNSTGNINTLANLTAKGSILTASAANTPASLAVGSNGDTLVADSSASTGLRWQEPKAGNPIINSAFQVWQRGTSIAFAATGSPYGPDRWNVFSGNTGTCSRQTTSDTTNLPNIQYAARIQRTAGQTGVSAFEFGQAFETINSIPFVGKTVTLSFYIRKGADFSGTTLNAQLISGTGTDQNPISGSYTGQATPVSSNIASSLTTTWQRISLTGTVATSATELTIRFYWVPSGTAGTNDWFEVTGVQLEVGSVATPFKTYSATLAGELAACQRYCYRRTTGGNGYGMATITAFGSNDGYARIDLPVRMRTTPTATLSGTVSHYRAYINNLVNLTSIGLAEGNTDFVIFNVGVTGNGLYGVGAAGWLASDTSGNGYLQLNAEL